MGQTAYEMEKLIILDNAIIPIINKYQIQHTESIH